VIQGQRGSYTMEALALLSALCIAAIFVFAWMGRQADQADHSARLLAEQAQKVAQALVAADPQARISAETLRAHGLEVPPPLKLTVPPGYDTAQQWRLEVWHPEGRKVFLVSAAGIQERFR